jgi:hypothetical protein
MELCTARDVGSNLLRFEIKGVGKKRQEIKKAQIKEEESCEIFPLFACNENAINVQNR